MWYEFSSRVLRGRILLIKLFSSSLDFENNFRNGSVSSPAKLSVLSSGVEIFVYVLLTFVGNLTYLFFFIFSVEKH